MPRRVRPRSAFRAFPFVLAWRVTEALWLLVLGLVLLVIAPRAVSVVSDRIRRGFGYSLLVGFILVIVLPVAAVIAALTFLGIPVAILLVLLYGATLIAAQIFPAAWLGRWLLGRAARVGAEPSPYLAQIVGTILLILLIAVPIWDGWCGWWPSCSGWEPSGPPPQLRVALRWRKKNNGRRKAPSNTGTFSPRWLHKVH